MSTSHPAMPKEQQVVNGGRIYHDDELVGMSCRQSDSRGLDNGAEFSSRPLEVWAVLEGRIGGALFELTPVYCKHPRLNSSHFSIMGCYEN